MSDTPKNDESPEYRDPTAPSDHPVDDASDAYSTTPSDADDRGQADVTWSGSDRTEEVPTAGQTQDLPSTESDSDRAGQAGPDFSAPGSDAGSSAPPVPPPSGSTGATPQNPYASPAPGAGPPQNPYAAAPPPPGQPGQPPYGQPAAPPPPGQPPYGQSPYGQSPYGQSPGIPGGPGGPPGYGPPVGGYGQAPGGYAPPRQMGGSTIGLLIVSGLTTLGCGIGIFALVFAIIAATKTQEPAEQAKFTRWGWIALGVTFALAVVAAVILVAAAVTTGTSSYNNPGY